MARPTVPPATPVPGAPVLPAQVPITLDRAADTPLAVQLAESLRAAAVAGQLRSGDRLPSTRALADWLQVSRTVTAAAYEQLHAEGWIVGRRGSGTFVTTTPPGTGPDHARRATEPTPGDGDAVDLTPGAPWVAGLDRAAWRRAWRAAADAAPLQRPERAGLREYRLAIAEHLLRHRGLVVGGPDSATPSAVEDAVLATGGTTVALAELAAVAFRPGDAVAIEEPGYQRAVSTLRAAGIDVVPIPVDAEGLIVDAVPARVKAVYCSPAHQYPLGGRMPAARRIALVQRAREHGWLIIEDDYDGELRYDVAPLPLLAALAPDVVVHLGTTSKILTPTLGVGWMVAPPEVAAAVVEQRFTGGTGPAAAGQRVVVELARHGDLGRHLRRLRREFAERRAEVVDTLTAAGLPVLGDDAGAHVVVPVADPATEESVVAAAVRQGLRVDGLARHHQGRPTRFGVPIGYAACSRAELRAALPILVDLLRPAAPHPG